MKPTPNAEIEAPPAYQVEDANLIQRLAYRHETALGLLYDRYNRTRLSRPPGPAARQAGTEGMTLTRSAPRFDRP